MEWKLLQYFPITLTVTWLMLSNGPRFSEGLKCYTCHTDISWDDCDKRRIIYNCGESQVCVKEHEIGPGSQQKFTKYCAPAEACTDDHCKKVGKRCTVDCCHQDLCNDSNQPYNASTIATSRTTIATSRTTLVFFILLVNIIYKFCLF